MSTSLLVIDILYGAGHDYRRSAAMTPRTMKRVVNLWTPLARGIEKEFDKKFLCAELHWRLECGFYKEEGKKKTEVIIKAKVNAVERRLLPESVLCAFVFPSRASVCTSIADTDISFPNEPGDWPKKCHDRRGLTLAATIEIYSKYLIEKVELHKL